MSIDITMFAVGLGTSILMRFERNGKVVRILLDGGSGKAGKQVAKKLSAHLQESNDSNPRIDLIIASHYDNDHLGGLVPILDYEPTIPVTEIWLPPILDDSPQGSSRQIDMLSTANPHASAKDVLLAALDARFQTLERLEDFDTLFSQGGDLRPEIAHTLATRHTDAGSVSPDQAAAKREIRKEDLLASKFFGEGGDEALTSYLNSKAQQLDNLDRLEQLLPSQPDTRLLSDVTATPDADRSTDGLLDRFERARQQAAAVLGIDAGEHTHEPATDEPRIETFIRIQALHNPNFGRPDTKTARLLTDTIEGQNVLRKSLANGRMLTSRKAINATALRKLMAAIERRADINWLCDWCADDKPLLFGWDAASRKFSKTPPPRAALKLTLLGPTERLVSERDDIIPRKGVLAATYDLHKELKHLENSNQLSYVIRVDFDDQSLLLTGDSGFDGFAIGNDEADTYEKMLTQHLHDLNIIQVPHHGGISRHFFRVMENVGFIKSKRRSYLLLSHERDDARRPSDAFASFMQALRSTNPAGLLFTAKPPSDRAKAYKHRAAPASPKATGEGDVILYFENKRWSVLQHLVKL